MNSNPPKPPAIRVSVDGIPPSPITMGEHPPAPINWRKIGALPAFQMFIGERTERPHDRDPERWAIEVATNTAARGLGQRLLVDYEAWHAKKGLWPNETPYGDLKE